MVVPFDGTQSFAASDNVARVLNLTQRDYAYMRRGPGFHGSLANVDVSSDPNIDHINIDKSPRLHARVVNEVLAITGGHRLAAPSGPKATPASAPAGQDGGTGSTTPASNSLKPDTAPAVPPAIAPTQATPGKTGNGADPGKASPVADGTPVIALPERGSTRQNAESLSFAAAQTGGVLAGVARRTSAELIFFAGFLITDRLIVKSFDCQHSLARKRVTLASGPATSIGAQLLRPCIRQSCSRCRSLIVSAIHTPRPTSNVTIASAMTFMIIRWR